MGGINEFFAVCIFSLHTVITFLYLEDPGSDICGQDRLEAETESQVRVEVGLELDLELGLGERLGWHGGGEDSIEVPKLNFPVHEDLGALG